MLLVALFFFSICSSLTVQFLNVWIYQGLFFFCCCFVDFLLLLFLGLCVLVGLLFFFFSKRFISFVVWKETVKMCGVYLIVFLY